jgi:hypothetical protein
VRGGGKIIAVGGMPSLAPGYADAQRITAQVSAASKALFGLRCAPGGDDAAVGDALAKALTPDFKVATQAEDVGFIHRKLADGDIYFIANTSNREVRTSATLRTPRKSAAWWNPHTGKSSPASVRPALDLALAPYESRVLVLTDSVQSTPALQPSLPASVLADLSRDWQLRFAGGEPQALPALRSWTDDPARRFFSGIATYSKDIDLTAGQLKGSAIRLDFGPGTPLATTPKVPSGMRAMLDSPIREAAEVYVNGQTRRQRLASAL